MPSWQEKIKKGDNKMKNKNDVTIATEEEIKKRCFVNKEKQVVEICSGKPFMVTFDQMNKLLEEFLPESLKCQEFLSVWGKWITHLHKHQKTPTAKEMKLCENLGIQKSIRIIEIAIKHDYKGLIPTNVNPNNFYKRLCKQLNETAKILSN